MASYATQFWTETERHHDLAQDYEDGIEWFVPPLKPYTVAINRPLHVRQN